MLALESAFYRQTGKYFGNFFKYKSIAQFERKVECSCKYSSHVLEPISEHLPPIYFVYDEKFVLLGSVLLRTFQTADLLTHTFERRLQTIGTRKLELSEIENSILIFSKTAMRSISKKTIESLMIAKNTLVADPIDSSIENIEYGFDFLISTESNFDFSSQNKDIQIHYLPHAPDWRLLGIKSNLIESKCLYLGHKSKDIFGTTPGVNVKKIYTREFSFRNHKPPNWIKELPKYSFHLTASKPAQASVARPTTKLITALMLGATPIIGKWEKGSKEIMGPGYPYVLNSFDPILAGSELPHLLSEGLLSVSKWEDLKRISEGMYCPVNHSNEWKKLFFKLK